MVIKPISILAFVLTLVTLVLVAVGCFLPRWFSFPRPGGDVHWHGLWHQQRCNNHGCADTYDFTKIEGGKEFFFIAKVFFCLTVLLVLVSFIMQVVYIIIRFPIVRQVTIYMLCGAGLFGLLATLMFLAKHDEMKERHDQTVELGPAFSMSLAGSILCLVASALTAWASYRKANYEEEQEDRREITHEMQPGGMDHI